MAKMNVFNLKGSIHINPATFKPYDSLDYLSCFDCGYTDLRVNFKYTPYLYHPCCPKCESTNLFVGLFVGGEI